MRIPRPFCQISWECWSVYPDSLFELYELFENHYGWE